MKYVGTVTVVLSLIFGCSFLINCTGAQERVSAGESAPEAVVEEVPKTSDINSRAEDEVMDEIIPADALIPPEKVAQMVEQDSEHFLLIDTRKSTDWVDFRIYRAKSYPVNQLNQRINFIKGFKKIIVAAADAKQAQEVWAIIEHHDLPNCEVLVMEGGYETYLAAGLPIRDNAPTRECY